MSVALWILVVDDEPAIRRTMARFFEHHGCAVSQAASGEEALTQLRARAYDAVVSDVSMPGLDGGALWTAACRLRPELVNRWVFVSAQPLPQALALAGQRHLEKPFDLEALWREVCAVAAPRKDAP